MTDILVPTQKTPIATIRRDQLGNLFLDTTREWYRYWSLLQQAVGGNTNVIIDIATLTPPAEGGASSALGDAEVLSLGAPDAGRIEWLAESANDLNPQIPGQQEFGEALGALDELTPFGMPPTELGALEAAKSLSYRILDCGEEVLVAGTATVNNVNANSANQFFLTAKVKGGTQGFLSVGTIVANTSFVINSSNAADTSTVSWLILGAIKG